MHAASANTSADIERLANLLQVSSTFGRAMEEAIHRLVTADEVHYAAKAKHTSLVKWRNRFVRIASDRVVGLRRTLIGKHVEPDLGRHRGA